MDVSLCCWYSLVDANVLGHRLVCSTWDDTLTLLSFADAGHIHHPLRIPQRHHFWRSSVLLLAVGIVSWDCPVPVQHIAYGESCAGKMDVDGRAEDH